MRRLILIIGLLVVGCAPKLAESLVEIPSDYKYSSAEFSGTEREGEWWERLPDATLRRLIEEAIAQNRTLAAQMAVMRSARYNLTVARATLLPDLSLDLSGERYREEQSYTSEYQLTPTVSWQLPLFGARRSTMEVAHGQLWESEWGYRATLLTLAQEVATTYYTSLQYRASREVSRQSLSLRTQATALIDSMHRYGWSSGVDLSQARALLYAAQQDLYSYDKAVKLSELSLALLLGRTIEQVDLRDLTTTLEQLPSLEAVPVGIPSDLLYNRPDIMESYYSMQQAIGKVGIARAAQFPTISLTADGGFFSTSLKGLTMAKLLTWDWAVELTQPLFNFRSLRGAKLSAVEQYNAALNSYEQTILAALNDVESALLSIATTRAESISAREYMESYASISRATEALYMRGMDNYLSVVDAQREYYASQIDYIELLAQQQIDYINLYTALGCRW